MKLSVAITPNTEIRRLLDGHAVPLSQRHMNRDAVIVNSLTTAEQGYRQAVHFLARQGWRARLLKTETRKGLQPVCTGFSGPFARPPPKIEGGVRLLGP
jgi:hypothetical protein